MSNPKEKDLPLSAQKDFLMNIFAASLKILSSLREIFKHKSEEVTGKWRKLNNTYEERHSF
jgi:hypothetical protein